jgi:hypothetical protein
LADSRVPLQIPLGIFRNGTKYQSAGRWFDANLVRFQDKVVVRPVGGWRRAPNDGSGQLAALSGIPRGATAWLHDSGGIHVAVGTTTHLYTVAGGVLHDITPTGFVAGRVDTTVPGNNPGTTSQGSSPYGQGPYGSGTYGKGSTLGVRFEADSWQLDNFGSHLIGVCSSDAVLVEWDGDPAHLAAMPDGAPDCRGIVVTPERFLFALGAFGNVRKIAWPSQETTTDWDPLDTNSAGDFDLVSEGRAMCGARTRRETLIWTDCDLHVATYIGGELIYRFDQVGDKCGIVSPRAYAVMDTKAIWMSKKGFYIYDGFTRPLASEVHDYVFTDINETQEAKVWATTVSEFGEVWFFYPSAKATEIDSYVIYNYHEDHWSIGKLARTAGVDKGAIPYPIMVKPTGEVMEHEYASDHEGAVPYVECGTLQLGNGDNVVAVQKLIPDEKTSGDVTATFYIMLEPNGPETTVGPYALTAETSVRFTARQARLRLTEARIGADWRVGVMALSQVPAGRR